MEKENGVLRYEDVAVGEQIPDLTKGPMTTLHLMRWSAAIENWHRIHYDQAFALHHDGLPDLLVNGSWKQHVLCQLLKDWGGTSGWVSSLKFEYRSVDRCNDVITAFGQVVSKEIVDSIGVVRCEIGIRNGRDEVSTVGEGTVSLPSLDGEVVPYPRSAPRVDAVEAGVVHRERSDWKYVNDEMLDLVGFQSAKVYAPEPVDLSSVRRFLQAIMENDPVYGIGPEGVANRFGGVVAPPLFPLHALRNVVGSPDPLDAAFVDPNYDGAGDVLTKHGLSRLEFSLPRLLNGGNQIEIFELARIGDLISTRSRIVDIFEKVGRSGSLVFVVVDSEYEAESRQAPLIKSRQTYIFR